MIYIASPVINQSTPNGTITRQVPTFLLDGDIQGIVSQEHAGRIVSDICNPTNDVNVVVHANVYPLREI
jgi:hypothetical protein